MFRRSPRGVIVSTTTREFGSLTGRALRRTASTSVKIAVFAPMPSASVKMAIAEKLGLRRSTRAAYCRSFQPSSIQADGRMFP